MTKVFLTLLLSLFMLPHTYGKNFIAFNSKITRFSKYNSRKTALSKRTAYMYGNFNRKKGYSRNRVKNDYFVQKSYDYKTQEYIYAITCPHCGITSEVTNPKINYSFIKFLCPACYKDSTQRISRNIKYNASRSSAY